jgi:hypothetical protein
MRRLAAAATVRPDVEVVPPRVVPRGDRRIRRHRRQHVRGEQVLRHDGLAAQPAAEVRPHPAEQVPF